MSSLRESKAYNKKIGQKKKKKNSDHHARNRSTPSVFEIVSKKLEGDSAQEQRKFVNK